MLDRIQMLMESLKRVSDDIAHDLRTPLSRLRHRLESVRSSEQAGGHGVVIEHAIAEVDGILDTFTALLRIAQIESGTRRAAFAQVDLTQVLATVAETYTAVAEEHGHRMRSAIGSGAAIHGDRDLILQMVANLVENAIQHVPRGGVITLGLRDESGGPVLCVRDTGAGIPRSERERVFRRFFRLEQHRTTPGNGLGLALVKAVVDLHGASIDLGENNPGLCVTVRFPRSVARDQAPAMQEQPVVSTATR
jgi:signal transduction histidine kinase